MRNTNSTVRATAALGVALWLAGGAPCRSQVRPIVYFDGGDLLGGAASVFGDSHYGETPVNYVYARTNGARSEMRVTFHVVEPPAGPAFLHLRARDDDAQGTCRIVIELNGVALHRGPSGFPSDAWLERTFPLPAGTLTRGDNALTIRNTEDVGALGMPPWFMVSRGAIADASYRLGRDLFRDFAVRLPAEKRPFPEPLASAVAPGFAVRGIKGWMWTPGQYLSEIPWLIRCKMNFLMNCYGSMCDIEHYPWGDPRVNRWWEPLPAQKKRAYERVVAACRKQGVRFCFSMNPNICTRRIVRYDSAEDLDLLWRHYAWMQSLGVRWFNISLDDISEGIDAAGQARMVNAIFGRLRGRDAGAQMIFCPTYYWGDGVGADQEPYLATLARLLDRDVYLFWTGDGVVGPITRRAAESFRRISGHRLFIWDNYPVNDGSPTMHLGPVALRDPDLSDVAEGYMSNPMRSQNEANRIPMFTCADYAYNPRTYDPERSIGQAILHQTESRRGREALADLVELYPGMLLGGSGSTAYNPVRERPSRILRMPHGLPAARAYVCGVETTLKRLKLAFPRRYGAEQATIAADVVAMRKTIAARYGPADR